MLGLFAANLILPCIHGVVGMINVRDEFSTAAKNATKKRHRRAAAPSAFPVLCFNSILSLSLSLSLLSSLFSRQQRAFVRSLVWLFVVRQSKYCPVTALVTNHAAPPLLIVEGFMLMAAGSVVREISESKNSSRPGANFGHRRRAAGSGAQFVIPMTKTESVMPSPTTSRV